ncbi:flavin containing polyamine [Cordyceps militaris]|uniref:Amine oxidase n=1 Tax=Cordyceps militaris TaxID=73501 RepID=A0A2H4SGZ7_CORMI|nr:flavin containing polyamine [Cordyceps militaris]
MICRLPFGNPGQLGRAPYNYRWGGHSAKACVDFAGRRDCLSAGKLHTFSKAETAGSAGAHWGNLATIDNLGKHPAGAVTGPLSVGRIYEVVGGSVLDMDDSSPETPRMPTIRHFAAALAVAAFAAPAAGLVAKTAAGDGTCTKTTVAILGGGMAGIAAAQALVNNSITDFMILEYNDRIGGRAQHANFGKQKDGSPYVIELGANWIQGLGHPGGPENPIWTLAKKHGLKNTYSNYSSILTYNETGPSDYADLLDSYSTAYATASAHAGRLLAENLQDQTARAGLALAGWNPRHSDMAAQAVEWWSWDWESAVPPEQSSLIFGVASSNLSFHQFSDENNLVIDARGYSYIIEQEASTFLAAADDARLRLGNHITNISYSDDGVTVHSADGSCVAAAYAICTFSVGVLQNDVVGFAPALPRWKRTAIQKFTMGTYTKIFLQFNETFWPRDTQFFLYASPTRRGWYPVFQSLSTAGFLPGSHILFVTVVADGAYRVEQQTDAQTRDEIMEVLRDMFPGVRVPHPTAFLYPRWTKEPWALGSYSNWPAGTTLEMHQNLRANAGRLWFAGEATSAAYFGFLHGAWFEGREAAIQIAAVLQSRCLQVYEDAQFCGETRPHYDGLHGTSPLHHYNLLNGWATSSFVSGAEESE